MKPSQQDLNRLFWHSRRGMRELDVLLIPFVKEVFTTLPEEQQESYSRLLECEDQELFGWFMERGRPGDAALAAMVDLILEYARNNNNSPEVS